MTTEEIVLWAAVTFIIIAGIWLAGLTYLMWRAQERTLKEAPAAQPVAEAPSPEPGKPT